MSCSDVQNHVAAAPLNVFKYCQAPVKRALRYSQGRTCYCMHVALQHIGATAGSTALSRLTTGSSHSGLEFSCKARCAGDGPPTAVRAVPCGLRGPQNDSTEWHSGVGAGMHHDAPPQQAPRVQGLPRHSFALHQLL